MAGQNKIKEAPEGPGGGPGGARVPTSRARTYAIVGLLCCAAGLIFLGSIISYVLGPIAVLLGYLARSRGETRYGLYSIIGGIAVITLSVVVTLLLLIGVIPSPAPPGDTSTTTTSAIFTSLPA